MVGLRTFRGKSICHPSRLYYRKAVQPAMHGRVAITGGLIFLAGLSYMLAALETGLAVGLIGIFTVALGLFK